MRHSTYLAQAPFYARPQRELNPIAVANPEWMATWWARRDASQARIDELMTLGRFAQATAYMNANPTVPITEESVTQPVPPLVEVDGPHTFSTDWNFEP